jgi:hypothetical protein
MSFHNPALDAEADDLLAQFAYHFQLQKSLVAELSKALEHRSNSKDDLEVLWDDMNSAKDPNAVLKHRIEQISDGAFAGRGRSEDRVLALCEKYKLDHDATTKLTAIMARRENVQGCDIDKDLASLDACMATSKKPSALICMKLKELSSGAPISAPGYPPLKGRDGTPPRDYGDEKNDKHRDERKQRGDRKSATEAVDATFVRGQPSYSAKAWSDVALNERFAAMDRANSGGNVVVMKAGMSNADILKQLGKLSPERAADKRGGGRSRSRDRRSRSRRRRSDSRDRNRRRDSRRRSRSRGRDRRR